MQIFINGAAVRGAQLLAPMHSALLCTAGRQRKQVPTSRLEIMASAGYTQELIFSCVEHIKRVEASLRPLNRPHLAIIPEEHAVSEPPVFALSAAAEGYTTLQGVYILR